MTLPEDPLPPPPADSIEAQVDGAIVQAKLCQNLHPDWPSALGPVTVAQFCLESGYGAHLSGKCNPFGVKARPGQPGTARVTHEVVNGVTVEVTAIFADYASLAEAFEAHGHVIVDHPKTYALALAFPNDPHAFAQQLTGVYATDPRYGQKLCDILDRDVLPRWDYIS